MSNQLERISVQKTYKIFVDGKFPRTESGRYFSFISKDGQMQANVCLSSRKDLRDAVTAAKTAQTKWAKSTAYNRGQILYRIAEMLETRRSQFVEELGWQGFSATDAQKELNTAIDRLVYYAGWSDKYQQIFSTVNPVASSYFNFSVLEPTGVVGLMAAEESPLVGLISLIAPAIVGGNTCVILASEKNPLSAVTFSEVLGTSDVPAGVVNILTGKRSELIKQFASHMELHSVAIGDASDEDRFLLEAEAFSNVKRVRTFKTADWHSEKNQSPYHILDFQEVKTTWHPIGL